MIKEEIVAKIKSGARVRVWEKIKEGDKEHLTKFEGLILAHKHGNQSGATFTVRAIILGVGVEKIYPLYSPRIERVEVLSSPKKIHRSKFYFIRHLSHRQTQRKISSNQ